MRDNSEASKTISRALDGKAHDHSSDAFKRDQELEAKYVGKKWSEMGSFPHGYFVVLERGKGIQARWRDKPVTITSWQGPLLRSKRIVKLIPVREIQQRFSVTANTREAVGEDKEIQFDCSVIVRVVDPWKFITNIGQPNMPIEAIYHEVLKVLEDNRVKGRLHSLAQKKSFREISQMSNGDIAAYVFDAKRRGRSSVTPRVTDTTYQYHYSNYGVEIKDFAVISVGPSPAQLEISNRVLESQMSADSLAEIARKEGEAAAGKMVAYVKELERLLHVANVDQYREVVRLHILQEAASRGSLVFLDSAGASQAAIEQSAARALPMILGDAKRDPSASMNHGGFSDGSRRSMAAEDFDPEDAVLDWITRLKQAGTDRARLPQ